MSDDSTTEMKVEWMNEWMSDCGNALAVAVISLQLPAIPQVIVLNYRELITFGNSYNVTSLNSNVTKVTDTNKNLSTYLNSLKLLNMKTDTYSVAKDW